MGEASHFSAASSERTRVIEHKLEHRCFHSNTRKNFSVRVKEHWNKLGREI